MADSPLDLEVTRYKYAALSRTFEFVWRQQIIEKWRPEYPYALNDVVRPIVGNGFYFLCTTAGESAGIQPSDWPTTALDTLNDGSVVWQCQLPVSIDADDILTSVFTLDAGLTEDSKAIDGQVTQITISGGVAGESYRVSNTITRESGSQETASFVLEILEPEDV